MCRGRKRRGREETDTPHIHETSEWTREEKERQRAMRQDETDDTEEEIKKIKKIYIEG